MKTRSLLLLLSLSSFPNLLAAADGGAAPGKPESHAYGAVGLMLASTSLSTPAGDTSSAGGGLVFNGAGAFDLGNDLGLGVNGQLAFGGETNNDDSSVTYTDSLVGFDGGILLAKVFYLSLGLQVQNRTYDDFDVTQTYVVVPLGLGMLWAKDDGYALVQLRFGGGQASNDVTSDTEDIGMFGIRLMGQTGTAKSLQFMGGLEMDSYNASDSDTTDFRFRMFFGLGFGG